ncbi:MAG: hypothetical protein JO322_05420 [Candidatus Eremiobacteraeota bacterium]|nr:hypothetical protein [Candidatus Eremiobacteraeota bacterium]
MSPGAATSAPAAGGSPYPTSGGTTMAYAGTLTQSFQTFTEVVGPSSSPEPVSTSTQKVSQAITVQGNQSFNGVNGLFDLHAAENDADSSGLKTTTSTTDTYEALAANGSGSQLLQYGSLFVDEAGDSTTTTYSSPLILDQLPEMGGALWTNSPAASIQQALAGNSNGSSVTVQRTIHSDGSYAENTTYPPGYSFPGYTGVGQIQENTDGSGTFAFVSNTRPLTIEYSVPVPQPTGSPLITVAEFPYLDPTAGSTPPPAPYGAVFQLPDWYGSAPQFYNETDRDLGQLNIPSSCNLNAQYPQTAYAIQQVIDRTDTILGYTEHRASTNYVAGGYGTLCSMTTDTITLYYDFSGDQAYAFSSKLPLEIDTVNETLALQPSPSAPAARTKAAFDASAAVRAVFDGKIAILRSRRERSLMQSVQHHSKNAGTK